MSTKVCQKRIGFKSQVCVNVPWDCKDNTPQLEKFSFTSTVSENDVVKKIMTLMDKQNELQKSCLLWLDNG